MHETGGHGRVDVDTQLVRDELLIPLTA